jgi:hypothetical protein
MAFSDVLLIDADQTPTLDPKRLLFSATLWGSWLCDGDGTWVSREALLSDNRTRGGNGTFHGLKKPPS